jgi:metal-dependent amidase/aminoacylase/carboxypeptidase family protein
MAHAIPASLMKFGSETSGIAGFRFSACHILIVEFTGQAAHAAGEPWKGINALDDAVAAYSNISLLRQQMITGCKVNFQTYGAMSLLLNYNIN